MIRDLLEDGPVVVNIGVREFADSLEEQGVEVVQANWVPPHVLDESIAALLEELG